jgi:two-component system, OmpR family, heavy metal sensor histidine kinase CusS
MPSIRRSLIAYFLVLMGITLLSIGFFMDRLISNLVQAREEAESARLKQEYEYRCRESQKVFDDKLRIHALEIASQLRREYNSVPIRKREEITSSTRMYLAMISLGSALDTSSAFVTYYTVNHNSVRFTLYLQTLSTVVTEDVIRRNIDDGEHHGYTQVHLPRTRTGRVPAIRPSSQSFDLPFDPDTLDRDPKVQEDYSEVANISIPNVGSFRRVVVRYPLIPQLNGSPFSPPRNREGPNPPRNTPPAPPPNPPTATSTNWPGLYVQFARRSSEIESILAEHEAKYDDDLTEMREELALHRYRALALISITGLVLLVALPTGCLWIVRRGLKPLDTFSLAVSQVSERDFRLPLLAKELSTDLLPIHHRLTETLDSLKRAFEREKQAVGDISHELRTPLAALMTTIEVSLRKPREAGQYKATLEDCREISRQLSRLVDRILMLASLDAGHVQQSRIPVSISELASECIAVIRPLADSHNVTLSTEVDPGIEATTDADKVREILMNLLHNAIEYNRPGGSILLKITREAERFRVVVQDTGIGMTPDTQAKIFERFFRADASRHTTGVHAGLGLAIVKEYISRLHGSIEVQSRPNEGTTFQVVLPYVAV